MLTNRQRLQIPLRFLFLKQKRMRMVLLDTLKLRIRISALKFLHLHARMVIIPISSISWLIRWMKFSKLMEAWISRLTWMLLREKLLLLQARNWIIQSRISTCLWLEWRIVLGILKIRRNRQRKQLPSLLRMWIDLLSSKCWQVLMKWKNVPISERFWMVVISSFMMRMLPIRINWKLR